MYKQGRSKTEILGESNALILNKVGAKLQKNVIFGTVLITFAKNWQGQLPPPVHMGATSLHEVKV